MRRRTRSVVVVLAALVGLARPSAAATSAELVRCAKGAETRAASFAKSVEQIVLDCAVRVERCTLGQEIDGDDPTACLAAASTSCTVGSTKLATLKTLTRARMLGSCGGVPLADLNAYTAGLAFAPVSAACGATTVDGLIACLVDDTQCGAERFVFTLDPRAQAALTTAGVAGAHPCIAP